MKTRLFLLLFLLSGVLHANSVDTTTAKIVAKNFLTQVNRSKYLVNNNDFATVSELIPPTLTMKSPVIQDTLTNTGPFDIYAYIEDASGIDTAYIVYQLNGGAVQYIPMLWISDSTYLGTIPSCSYNNRIDYHVFAVDNSASHNFVDGPNQWFYIKQGLPDVIIGSGTVTTNNYYPFYNYYENNRSQMLYKATEINRAGVISHLAFNLSYITSNAAKRHLLNFTIKIKPTNVSTLGSAYTDMSTATTVFFNPDFYQMSATGWYTFDINDYFYDGLSNLIVELLWGDNGGYASSGDLYDVYKTDYNSGSDILVAYGFADSETPPNYDGNSKIRPNIKFTFPITDFSNDACVKQVLSPSGYAISSVNLPVNLYIKNYSADSLKKVTVAWNLDGIPQQPFSWTGVLLHDVVSSALNIGSVNVASGAHTIKAWTEFPNDSLDQNHINDTSCISFWAFSSVMNGTFTIGSSGADFLSFTDALNALVHYGINGPVVFKVQSGTYNEQISFPEISGASAINTITFQSLTGINTDVVLQFPSTSTESNYVIRLNGADHLRFKNMTFHATGAIYAHVIEITNNAVDNMFDGNKITGKVAELYMTDEVLVCKKFGVNSIDSLTVFNNNNFTNGSCAIYFTGSGSPSILTNKTCITNNIFTNQYFYGVYLVYQNAPTISGNVISTNSDADPYYGIYTGYCYNDLKILKNKVYFPSDGYGIFVGYCNGTPSKKGMIANNFVRSGNSFGGSALPRGIYTYYSPYQEIYYNSVNIRAISTTGSAFYLGSGCTPIVLKNNIFANSSDGYAIYSSATTGITSNFNDLYTTGSNLGYWGANKATITEWQASSSQDANSVSINPNFVSSTDLHTFYTGLNGMAIPIVGITNDIDGETRNVSFPDIGADEFTPYDLGILSVVSPDTTYCGQGGDEPVTIELINLGNTVTNVDIYYQQDNGIPIHEVFNGSIMPYTTYDYTFIQHVDLSANTNHLFKFYVSLANDLNIANDTMIKNVTVFDFPTAEAGANATYEGTPILIGDTYSGPGIFSWSPASGLSDLNISQPLASPTATTTYTLTVNNNGCIATDTVTIINGVPTYSISGKTRYLGKANVGFPVPNPPAYNSVSYNIDNVIVILKNYPSGTEVVRDTSDALGNYQLNGITDGNYMISYDKYTVDSMQWSNDANAIDIALAKYLIGADTLVDPSRNFSSKYKSAANVDNNTDINAVDIARIKAKVGSPYIVTKNLPKGNWVAIDTLVTVAGADLNVTLKTICYGDFNASSTKYRDSLNTWSAAKSYDKNIISLSDEAISITNPENIEVPLRISLKMNDFSALGLELNYPSNDFKLVNVTMPKVDSKNGQVKINPTLDEIITDNNDLLVTDENGVIRVVYATTNHFDVDANDEIIRLGFRSINELKPGQVDFSLNGPGVIGNMYGEENENAYIIMPKVFVQDENTEAGFEFAGYPNPFSGDATLTYGIPENGFVKISVYNSIGNLVGILVSENQEKGGHKVAFKPKMLTKDMYTFKLEYSSSERSTYLVLKLIHL